MIMKMPADLTTKRIKKALVEANQKDLAEVLYDAHTIWDPKTFTDLGFPPKYVKSFLRTYKSDGSHKGNIYADDGSIIKEVGGVSSHRIVEDIARRFNLHTALEASYMKAGRGSSLAVLTDAVLKHVEESVA
tara:strand:+ start:467 stop:862 length:396 start_codon:yes stop_codon:yes gene_type:complete